MRFEYTKFLSLDLEKMRKRPMLEVELFGEKGSVTVDAIVDSGADSCIFNVEYAEAIGVDLANCEVEDMIGISGVPMRTYRTKIEIEVKHLDRFELPVAFIESTSVNGLLGQEGFFDRYRIRFERDRDVFEVAKSMRAKKKKK